MQDGTGDPSGVQHAFGKLLGRQATREECERLHRVREVLGLADNDALWTVVLALEHYDAFFRRYPERLAEVTEEAIEKARAACAMAAEGEVALVQRALADRVAETSVVLARRIADKPIGLHRVTLVLAAVVAFGALCMAAGYRQALAVAPPGVPSRPRDLLELVLAMPAGWMVFALLVPAAVYGVRVGWWLARRDAKNGLERVLGWALLALCVIGVLACAALVAKVA
jgi:hypothetical protein